MKNRIDTGLNYWHGLLIGIFLGVLMVGMIWLSWAT
ncbi:hypothetical protein LCGC14_1678190 [marine sediment metagenome]|uniref:Uncharacterized protein n=1 Tax=marine sediment metagenome TaxID=412755 RepID=A0A0F9KPC4_9ZZZZ